MSGVRPIEMIVQTVLSEQAPTVILYNHFCMADCYKFYRNFIRKYSKIETEVVYYINNGAVKCSDTEMKRKRGYCDEQNGDFE